METFKITTFNTHHGKEKDVKYSTEKFCEDIKSLDSDILCLQEVDGYSLRTKLSNQSKALARYLGYQYHSSFVRFFGIGFQYNTIISRFPFSNIEQIILPSSKGTQRRIATRLTVETNAGPVIVVNTHLHSDGKLKNENVIAKNQLMYLTEISKDENIILAGDFNLAPGSVIPIVTSNGFSAPSEYKTSPACNPKNQIDWLLSKGYKLENFEVSDQLASDHRALSATFDI